jgi:hypothetical protein
MFYFHGLLLPFVAGLQEFGKYSIRKLFMVWLMKISKQIVRLETEF